MSKETKDCCEKCKALGRTNENLHDYVVPVCRNSVCPCHTPAPKSEEEKIIRGAEDFANRFEGVMKELAEEDAPKEDTGWEEEFDKESYHEYEDCSAHGESQYCCLDIEHKRNKQVKDFIRKTRSQAKQEVIEELKEICNKCKTERGLARAIGNFIKEYKK